MLSLGFTVTAVRYLGSLAFNRSPNFMADLLPSRKI
jgi:hypothetical protein